MAVQHDHIRVVMLLLQKGANPNLQNATGRTPLASAAAKKNSKEIIRVLIEAGADERITTHFHETPIDIAKRIGNTEVSEAIEEYSASQRQKTINVHRSG